MKDCPKCNGTMEDKGTIEQDVCGSGCCNISFYQCPECKNVEIN